MMSSRKLVVFLSLFGLISAAAAGPPSGIVGDYAGWAYLDDGGDFPMRMQCTSEAGGLAVKLGLPHEKIFGLATTNARLDGSKLLFERRNREGKLWTYKADLREDRSLAGDATLEGNQARFRFELHRSEEPLPPTLLERAGNYLGTYRGDSGRTIVLTSWFWDELRFFDIQSGRQGTLFPTAKGDFIVGPAEYIPAPVWARIGFQRRDDGTVKSLLWTPQDSWPETLDRLMHVEEPIEFRNDTVQLRGTFIKPAGAGAHPAMVILGGSDWHTRGQVRREADIFVSVGLGALIYDARGNGESSGEATCSFEETAGDVRAAVATLAARSDVDPKRIGVFGRSRGGWFAPLAASKCPDVSFLLLFVPPAISPARQETTRRLNEMRASGYSEAEVREANDYLELLWQALRSDADWDKYADARSRVAALGWYRYADGIESRDSDDFRWSRLNMHYDPVPVLEKVKCPVLALFGERDTNVTPAENVATMEAALMRAGNKDFTLRTLDGANHGLRPVAPGSGAVPLHRGIGYAPELWPTVQEWLRARSLGHVKRRSGE